MKRFREDHPALSAFAFIAVGFVLLSRIAALASNDPAWFVGVMVAGIIFGAWKFPPLAASIALCWAVWLGGWPALLGGPFVVLLALRWRALNWRATDPAHVRMRDRAPRTWVTLDNRAAAVVGVLTALVVSLLLSSLVLSLPQDGAGASAGGYVQSSRESAPSGPTWLARLVDRVLRGSGLGDGGVAVPPEEPRVDWVGLALVLLAVAALVGSIMLIVRRLRRRPAASTPLRVGEHVARLEQIGMHLGRPRKPHDGVAEYARRLSAETGDVRLATAGQRISDRLYQQDAGDSSDLDFVLDDLESNPPAPLPPLPADVTPDSRIERNVASAMRLNRTAIAFVAVILALGAFLAVGSLTDLALPTRESSSPSRTYEKPEIVTAIDATIERSSDAVGWTRCVVYRGFDDYWYSWRGDNVVTAAGELRVLNTEVGNDSRSEVGWYYHAPDVGTITASAREFSSRNVEWIVYPDADLEGWFLTPPDFGSLDGLDSFSTDELVDGAGNRVQRRYLAADWRANSETPYFLSSALPDDLPWTLDLWIEPDGSIDRVELRSWTDGVATWTRYQLGFSTKDLDASIDAGCPLTEAEVDEVVDGGSLAEPLTNS